MRIPAGTATIEASQTFKTSFSLLFFGIDKACLDARSLFYLRLPSPIFSIMRQHLFQLCIPTRAIKVSAGPDWLQGFRHEATTIQVRI